MKTDFRIFIYIPLTQRDGMSIAASSEMRFDPSWGRIFLDFIVYKYPTLLESFWDQTHGDINMSNDITSTTLRLEDETVNRIGRTYNHRIKEAIEN